MQKQRQKERPARTDTDRRYLCIQCGEHFTTFQSRCPICGQREFRTGAVADSQSQDSGDQDTVLEEIAAQFNPYIPR